MRTLHIFSPFVIIFAVILGSVTFVMRNKYYFLKKNAPNSSLDIVFLGSSHIVNSINPMLLYEKYGFENIGTFKGFFKIHGEYVDCELMNLYL